MRILVPDNPAVSYAQVSGSPTYAWDGSDLAAHTIEFTTVNEGDLVVLAFATRYQMSGAITGIVDTGATPATGPGAWKKVVDFASTDNAANYSGYVALWMATVSAVGTYTATITITGAAGTDYQKEIFEFSSNLGTDALWQVVASGGGNQSNVGTEGPFSGPTLDASVAGQFEVVCSETATAPTSGATPGWTYYGNNGYSTERFNMLRMNLAAGAVTGPALTQSSAFGFNFAAAIFEAVLA